MMLAIQITAVGIDDNRTQLRILTLGLAPARLHPIIGESARGTIKDHLVGLDAQRPNALGGRRTHFYTDAADATQFRLEGDKVIVSINHVGIAQRYFGGTIVPVTAKYLTIPARAEAHGKRAREFNDLTLVFGRGGKPIALARRASTAIGFRLNRKSGLRRAFSKGEQGGEILFWLKKEVTQRADPSVLPTREKIELNAQLDVARYVERLVQRQ